MNKHEESFLEMLASFDSNEYLDACYWKLLEDDEARRFRNCADRLISMTNPMIHKWESRNERVYEIAKYLRDLMIAHKAGGDCDEVDSIIMEGRIGRISRHEFVLIRCGMCEAMLKRVDKRAEIG